MHNWQLFLLYGYINMLMKITFLICYYYYYYYYYYFSCSCKMKLGSQDHI